MFEFTFSFADIWPFILVGLGAQIIDGALGMAFGVLSQTMLVSLMGMPPAAASATTHLVEMFTTGASGASHIWHRNVDWGLFRRLVPFGIVGGVLGAYALTSIDASAARPFVMIYLTGIGLYLLVKAIRMTKPRFEDPRMTRPLAIVGGFLDAAGGGGWGPVVTSTCSSRAAIRPRWSARSTRLNSCCRSPSRCRSSQRWGLRHSVRPPSA